MHREVFRDIQHSNVTFILFYDYTVCYGMLLQVPVGNFPKYGSKCMYDELWLRKSPTYIHTEL